MTTNANPALPAAGPGSLPGATPTPQPGVPAGSDPAQAPGAPSGVTPPAPAPDTPPATPPSTNPQDALALPEDDKPATPVDTGPAPVEWEPTGNPSLDLALDFVGKLGFGPEHPAMIAAEAGDFSKLEAECKKLGDKAKGYEKYLAAGKTAFEGIAAEAKAKGEKLVAKINEFAGDPNAWAEARAWAGKNAEPAEKAAINAALKEGGVVAFAVAKHLIELHQRQPGATKTAASALVPGASNTSAASNALSPQQYAAAVAELYQRQGTVDGTPEYAALQARRNAWKG
jgi:hypothetical protein